MLLCGRPNGNPVRPELNSDGTQSVGDTFRPKHFAISTPSILSSISTPREIIEIRLLAVELAIAVNICFNLTSFKNAFCICTNTYLSVLILAF